MRTVRAHVVMPQKLAEEIDELVGPRGRSAFLVQTAEAEVKRRRLLAFLESDIPAWKDEDHPELADGAYEWVKKMRQESDRRIPDDGLEGAMASDDSSGYVGSDQRIA